MAQLNPDAPEFDVTKLPGTRVSMPEVDPPPTPTSSFVPNPEARAFRPNPDAPAYQPKPSVPLLGGFKLKRPAQPPIAPGSPGGGGSSGPASSPHLGAGEQASRYAPVGRVNPTWGGNSPMGSSGGSAPFSSPPAPPPGRPAPRPTDTPDPAPGSHFTVNGSDSATPPHRTWQAPQHSTFPHATNVSAMGAGGGYPATAFAPAAAARTNSPVAAPASAAPSAPQQPSPLPSTPQVGPPVKAMGWVPPHQKLVQKLGKVFSTTASPPGATPQGSAADTALATALPPEPPTVPSELEGPAVPPPAPAPAPKATLSPKSIPPPPHAMKGWIPPHQRHLLGKGPTNRLPEANQPPPAAPTEPPVVTEPQQQSPPPSPPRDEPPAAAPASRPVPASIPPRISSAPMAKGAAALTLNQSMAAIGAKRSAMPGLPSRPLAAPIRSPPAATNHADPSVTESETVPSPPAPLSQQQEPAAAPPSPPPRPPSQQQQQQQPMSRIITPAAAPGVLPPHIKAPPTGTPAAKTWQPPRYGKRMTPLTTSVPASPPAAVVGGVMTAESQTTSSPTAPPPPTAAPPVPMQSPPPAAYPQPPRPPLHHHHHHHQHHSQAMQTLGPAALAPPGFGAPPPPPPAGGVPLSMYASAPNYVPKKWQPPHRKLMVPPILLQARPTPEDPLVVLIYGCRGAGKTTQATALAARYNLLCVSSGKWFREDKKPFEELRATVLREFGPGVERKYNGIVLDRFVVTSEVDAYYIQSALRDGELPVPMTVWLKVDPAVGMQRAEARGDDKVASDHWRLVELRAQAAAADRLYGVIGSLETIDTDGVSEAEVTRAINHYIDLKFPHRSRHISLPENTVGDSSLRCPLLERHEQFAELSRCVHLAVGNTTGRMDSAPLSTIGGYVDKSYFAFGNKPKRSVMMSSQVTLKVDGQRFLVGKHKNYGYVGLPFLFQSCYDFNNLFVDLPFPDRWGAKEISRDDNAPTRHGFEVLLDCELSVDEVHGAVLHVIDFIYFYGMRGKKPSFQIRYNLLQDWFFDMRDNSPIAAEDQPVQLKEYVPVQQLGELLPTLEDAPFPIDGIVFQHPNGYRYGPDKFLLKWKPQDMCTADFRLAAGLLRDIDNCWQFDLHVSDSQDQNTLVEVPFPHAKGIFTQQEVAQYKLRDGVIVELSLFNVDDMSHHSANSRGGSTNNGNQRVTTWRFHRLRSDKPTPNKLAIVKEIVELQNIKYAELVRLCADLSPPSGK